MIAGLKLYLLEAYSSDESKGFAIMAFSSSQDCIPDDDILQVYRAENITTFQSEGILFR